MNKENLNYLKDNLKYHGFSEKLHTELEQKIMEGAPHFQIQYNASINTKSFDALLNFRRGDDSDMYFFNNYTAKLDRGVREHIEQTFYINKGRGITAKEAFNLLDGRSVFKEMMSKEGTPYNAWLQLNPDVKDHNNNYVLKQYHTNYGFDMGNSLTTLPIKELHNDEDRIKLIKSLEKGNLQAVTFEHKGKEERMFIEANPQYKTFTIYNSQMKRVKNNVEQKEGRNQPLKNEADTNKNDAGKLKKESRTTASKTKENGEGKLLPKKRESKKRGLTP